MSKTALRKTLISWNLETLAKNVFYIKMIRRNVQISFHNHLLKKLTHIKKKRAQKTTLIQCAVKKNLAFSVKLQGFVLSFKAYYNRKVNVLTQGIFNCINFNAQF